MDVHGKITTSVNAERSLIICESCIMIRLSKVSKIDGIRSWSLEAGVTCPGSKDGNQIFDSCAGCYAKTGNYHFPNVKQVREINRAGWKHENWVDHMVMELDNDRYFRWFDSGDVYHPDLAAKIYEVCKRTDWVKHWIPTMSYRHKRIRPWLDKLKALPNVSVRFSSGSISGEFDSDHGSVIIPKPEAATTEMTLCEAFANAGKCSGCRKCWDKSIKLIAYPAHGRKMEGLIKSKCY